MFDAWTSGDILAERPGLVLTADEVRPVSRL
jgi:hypothetical protein